MSSTMQGIDARAMLIGWAKSVTSMYVADIKATPDDKWTATFGGCTRPPNELTADAMGLLIWCTAMMKGEEPPASAPDTITEFAAKIATKDAAIAKFNHVVDAFTSALAAASDEKLNSTVTPPWQMDAPLFLICQIAVSHIWYHDGQINYIHCLLGDGTVHWMDPA